MNLLELAEAASLQAKRTAATKGGEYHCSCPGLNCGGKDRFIIWSETNRYWCRQCGVSGDAIQFCRDFLGMNYREACEKVGKIASCNSHLPFIKKQFVPASLPSPSEKWRAKAEQFVFESCAAAQRSVTAQTLFRDRGFTQSTINAFRLGWNELNRSDALNLWGIEPHNEQEKSNLWLPRGIVIPTHTSSSVIKLKIRRANLPPDDVRKYVVVTGSQKSPSFYGKTTNVPIVIVEAELDAILLQQEAGDLCCSMAIPAGNKPDLEADQILRRAPLLLFALDSDEPGKKAYRFWKSAYPQMMPWPVPRAKSPGDAFKEGVNLRAWIESGISIQRNLEYV